ncbi:MAG: CHAT domain-containing protein [Anaerolineae bacterium]
MSRYQDIVALEAKALDDYERQRYEDAIVGHGQALALAKDLNRPRLMAVLFNRLGQALEAQGDIQRAVTAYEAGLRALSADRHLELEEVMMSLLTVGKGYFEGFGDFAVPDLYSQATVRDLEAGEAEAALPTKLLINAGNAYLRQPQDDPALNAYEQALNRPEIADAPELRAHALTHVGIIRRRRGDVDAAEEVLDEALRLLEVHADPLAKRRALAALAGIYRDRGQSDAALKIYQQAIALYAQAEDPLGQGRTRAGLGHLYLEQGRFGEAQATFQHAVELATAENDDDTLWHAYWGLGRCQQQAGRLDDAASSFRRSLDLINRRQQELRTDEGKVTFIDSVRDVYDQLIAVHLAQAQANPARHRDALEVAEEARGQAFRDLMGRHKRRRMSQGAGIRPSRQRNFGERLESARQMAPGIPMDFNPAAQMAPGIASGPSVNPSTGSGRRLEALLNEAAREIHQRLDDKWPLLAERAPEAPGGDALEAVAEEDEELPEPPPVARLVFHVLPDRTAVFAVMPDGTVQGHVVGLGREAMADRVAQLRRVLRVDDNPRGVRLARDARRTAESQAPADPEPLLRELYAALIAPVAKALPDDGTPVVIEPHGVLWLLPFAALSAPDGTWLADRWPLLYAPSARVFDDIRHEPDYGGPGDLKALIVGNPSMPEVPEQNGLEIELEPLPGAEQEARAIAGLLPEARRTLLLGSHADREAVETLMQTHGIVHLATHGIAFAEDPLKSFIALTESQARPGLLTASDVSYLWLPADLVTLSACQTGLGKISGEGMIGLSRAFLAAGARSVLVSLWSVSDEATAELMAAFYQGYLELDDKAIALQRAMRELRSRPEYAHPRYWAPFVVIGAEA